MGVAGCDEDAIEVVIWVSAFWHAFVILGIYILSEALSLFLPNSSYY